MMKALLIAFYLDYMNEFLTVERFAEHYNYTIEEANILLDAGKKLNEL